MLEPCRLAKICATCSPASSSSHAGAGANFLARELAAMEKTDEPAALQKILAILNEHAPKYYETAPA